MEFTIIIMLYALGFLLISFGTVGLLMGLIGDHHRQQHFIRRLKELAHS